jgi:tetratricopeptide (TPR) repeat protein
MTPPRAFLLALLLAVPAAAAPSNPLDLLQEGLEAMMDERYEAAAAAFQNVLQYEPANVAAQRGLKTAQQKVQEGLERRRAGEKPALDAARRAMGRKDWAEAAARLGDVLARQGDHPEALALRRKISALMTKQMEKSRPQSGDWFYAQGVLSYMDGDWLKAVDSWDQVVAFDPDRAGLVENIERAKQNLQVREREEKIRFHNAVAFEGLKKGDYAEAIRQWEALLALDPGNLQAREGVAEARRAREAQALRDRQEEVQKLSEQAMDAYINREQKKSRALWNQVLALDPENGLAREYLKRMGGGGSAGGAPSASGYEKAMDFLADNRYAEAIEYLERHTARNPGDQKARASLEDIRAKQKTLADKSYQDGLMAYSQGDVQGAITHWQTSLRTDPDYQRARQAIIKAMAEQRKRSQ